MPEKLAHCPVCNSTDFSIYLETADYFLTGEPFSIVQCNQCHFRFTNPRPLASDLGRYYKSEAYISHSDTRRGIFNSVYQQARKLTLARKKSFINKLHTQKGTLLDIGCATGQFLSTMKENGWTTTGIEPDDQARQYAVDKFGLEVFPEEYLDHMPEAAFDVITLWHVLEHVSNLPQRMMQLKRLLKANGTLIIAVPNSAAHDAAKYGKFWAAYDVPRHLYHFTAESMKTLTEKFDFHVTEIRPMIFDAFYVSLLSEKYLHGKMRVFSGLWNGFCSNLKASGKKQYSSLIYVIKNAPASF